MKRAFLAMVACFTLLTAVETAKADWVFEVAPSGWVGWRWDPPFDDGTFDGYPDKPTPIPFLPVVMTEVGWFAIWF